MRQSIAAGIIVLVTLAWALHATRPVLREAYNYTKCRDRGFDRTFCTITPIDGVPTPPCTCWDGRQGAYVMDRGATCVCE